ncbi:MAG: hypothetical protein RMK84_12760 [Oscillochloridaceae bacterium]|nr:hypothetical protein [Chloroflexaceae bacterium]MDW8390990.1 hypothetical protein [Oscillochloridaceae bacterium]
MHYHIVFPTLLLIAAFGCIVLMIRSAFKETTHLATGVVDTERWVTAYAGFAFVAGIAVLSVWIGVSYSLWLTPILLIGGSAPALISIVLEASSLNSRPRRWGRHLFFFVTGVAVVLASWPLVFKILFTLAHTMPR